MVSERYAQLNPWALAVAAGCVALVGFVILGFPIASGMHMGAYGHGMMGGGYGAAVMWHAWSPWFLVLCWIGSVIVAMVLGAVFGWVYNALNGRASTRLQP